MKKLTKLPVPSPGDEWAEVFNSLTVLVNELVDAVEELQNQLKYIVDSKPVVFKGGFGVTDEMRENRERDWNGQLTKTVDYTGVGTTDFVYKPVKDKEPRYTVAELKEKAQSNSANWSRKLTAKGFLDWLEKEEYD